MFYFSALVWGSSVKHQPQKVGKDHVLNDEDVVQIVKKVWLNDLLHCYCLILVLYLTHRGGSMLYAKTDDTAIRLINLFK